MIRIFVNLILTTVATAMHLHAQLLTDSTRYFTFSDTSCQIIFDYPDTWTVQRIKSPFYETECAFGLKPPDWDSVRRHNEYDVSEYSIYICLYNGALDSTAERFGLIFENDSWWFIGRFNSRDQAATISSLHWTGIIGQVEVGLYLKDRGYCEPQSTFMAYLDNRKGTLLGIIANWACDDKSIFDQLVNSIRF